MSARAGQLGLLLLAGTCAAAPPPPVPGFPTIGGVPGSAAGITPMALAPLPPGQQALVATVGAGLTAVDAAGRALPGFPVELSHAVVDAAVSLRLEAPPTACDLDGDGTVEILVAGSNGRLFAVDGRGAALAGFPLALGGRARGPLACLPAPAGRRESHVLALTDAGALLRVGAGGRVEALARVAPGSESGVGIGAPAPGAPLLLAFGGGDGRLHVTDRDGAPRPGFPARMGFRSGGVPALADLDDDGQRDIVVASEDFSIHAFAASGAPLPGFPVATGYRLYAGVALADLDDDGVPDVIAPGGDGRLYALDGRGRALPGFPVALEPRLTGACAVADLDGDGRMEVALVGPSGRLHLLGADGRPRPGFPLQLTAGSHVTAPAFADLDGDGAPELAVQDRDGSLAALRGGAPTPRGGGVAWGTMGHGAAHDGLLAPLPRRYVALGYEPAAPRASAPVTARYATRSDEAAPPAPPPQVRWFQDGVPRPELDGRATLPAGSGRKHQRWHYTLQDAAAAGRPTRTFVAPPVVLANTPPSAPEVALQPARPRAGEALGVQVVTPPVDADGDALTLQVRWRRNGEVTPAAAGRRGELWEVAVVASDGEASGPPGRAACRIANTPPPQPALTVSPTPVQADSAVVWRALPGVPDADGDGLHYVVRVAVNGRPLPVAADARGLAPGVLRRGDAVRVELCAADGQATGPPAAADFTVANAPPPAPALRIEPAAPRVGDGLALALAAWPVDPDGDRVVLRHAWTRDGRAIDCPAAVPPAATRKGQCWQVCAAADDGRAPGARACASARIANTPPSAPHIALDRPRPTAAEAVHVAIAAVACDPDGDALQYRAQWFREGDAAPRLAAADTLPAGHGRRGERWRVEVAAHDGEAWGPPAVAGLEFVNAAPAAPQPALTPARPRRGDTLRCAAATPADCDGDVPRLQFRWLRDGVVQPLASTAESLPPGQLRRGEAWACAARADDGTDVSAWAEAAAVRVENTPPAPPEVAIEPASPTTEDALACVLRAPAIDRDGDVLAYRVAWTRDGQPFAAAADGIVPASATARGEVWRCALRAHDGIAEGAPGTAAQTIGNAPPGAPAVRLEPAAPRAGEPLRCAIAAPAVDPDGDAPSYRFVWRRDGAQQPFAPTSAAVPGRLVRAGEAWRCCAVAVDTAGAAGPPGTSFTHEIVP